MLSKWLITAKILEVSLNFTTLSGPPLLSSRTFVGECEVNWLAHVHPMVYCLTKAECAYLKIREKEKPMLDIEI